MASWGIGYYGICFGSICSHKLFSPFLNWDGWHVANCSAPCGPIWPKFHVENGNDANFVWPGRGTWEQWPKNRNEQQVIQAKIADYDYKLTQNISHNIQSPMKPYQAVSYIKKNLRHSAITTSKYIKFHRPCPEIRGV